MTRLSTSNRQIAFCIGILLSIPLWARADNWVDIVGKNRLGQTVIVNFEGRTDGHAFIMVRTKGGEIRSFEDEPCERPLSASVQARLKDCEKNGQEACDFPPDTDLSPVKLICSKEGTSPLAGTIYRIMSVKNEKTCVAYRYKCIQGCNVKDVPLVMEQGIDECSD